ncbi:MAG: hypothetical protein IPL61_13005 [Myxococcales bacterium]|nr:hypothetical protein [Myxococcales bacterium]
MISARVTKLKKRLDRLAAKAEGCPAASDPRARKVFDAALANFVSGGDALLDKATKYLWKYYRATIAAFDDAELDDYEIPRLARDTDIWKHVAISRPPSFELGRRSKYEPGISYFSFEGEVSWEPEHGLQLVFEHGRRVCKVGPYDGHHTQAHAYDDLSLLRVVFKD